MTLLQKFASALTFFGGVGGVLSMAAVLVFGGEYKRQTAINTQDIAQIKQSGTPLLRAHADMDDERVGTLKKQESEDREDIKRLQVNYVELLKTLGSLHVEIAKITVIVEDIQKRVEKNNKP